MKYWYLVAMLSVLMASSFSAAFVLDERRIDLRHDLSTAIPHEDDASSSVAPARGGGKACRTMWGWDGSQWIKRDVIRSIVEYKGRNYKNTILTQPITITNLWEGKRCSVVGKKPMIDGTVVDVAPLPQNWYKMRKS